MSGNSGVGWLFVLFIHDTEGYQTLWNKIVLSLEEVRAGDSICVMVIREVEQLRVFQTVKARRRILACFSHGAAFGIHVDPGSDGILWIGDLADLLKGYLGEDRIDMLVMNSCYMQNFDAGYWLKEVADYLVAAEGGLHAAGFDYPALLSRLKKDPAVSGADLAKGMIEDYRGYYEVHDMDDDLEQQAVFAVDLCFYPLALTLFDELLGLLAGHWSVIVDDLIALREKQIAYVSCPLLHYSSNYLHMVDAFQWTGMVIDRLQERIPAAMKGKDLAVRFRELKSRLVVAGYVGRWLTVHDEAEGILKYGYSGISLFYPLKRDLAHLHPIPRAAYFGDRVKSEWQARWLKFLHALTQHGRNF